MIPTATTYRIRPARAAVVRRGRGFSFTEILFAVMILGVGFIMVAALFPVAAYQTQATAEETIGAATARSAVGLAEQAAYNVLMPATGNMVVAFSGDQAIAEARREAVAGNLLVPSDPRYGWLLFYRRAGVFDPGLPFEQQIPQWPSHAQVFLVPVKAGDGKVFATAPDLHPDTRDRATGDPTLEATVLDGAENADTIEFTGGQTSVAATVASEGAYVIIASATAPAGAPAYNGRIFRLGATAADAGFDNGRPLKYELIPGSDFTPEFINVGGTFQLVNRIDQSRVFVIGRPSGEGGATDIGIYTTFVTVR